MNLPPGGPLSGMAADVRAGLTRPFKELSPRYFYDERGSQLFEEITELEEYYPTRCERAILDGHAADICTAANRPASLIELGSGLGAEDPGAAGRDAGGCLPGDLLPGRHLRGDHPRHGRAGGRRVRGDQRARPGLRLRARPRADPGRRPARDRPARRDDRQLRAPAARGLPAADLEPAGSRRPLPARHRPGQGPGDPGGRLQRLEGRHRRVQQERPLGPQPRAARRLRARRLRARRPLGSREPLDRHPAPLARPTRS